MNAQVLIAWAMMSLAIGTHQMHALNFRGASQKVHLSLHLSFITGTLTQLVLFAIILYHKLWWTALASAAFSFIVAWPMLALIFRKIPFGVFSLFSFLIWPTAAIWAFLSL